MFLSMTQQEGMALLWKICCNFLLKVPKQMHIMCLSLLNIFLCEEEKKVRGR